MGSSSEHLGPTTDCQTKVGLSGITLTQFQQAGREMGARQCSFRGQRQRASAGVGGKGILAVHEKDASERCQDIRTARRKLLCLQQDCACLAAIIAVHVEVGQVQLKIDTLWREREGAFNDVDCFAKTSIPGELTGKLLKGRQEWRPARRGAAQ
jgi:hypothetical protein